MNLIEVIEYLKSIEKTEELVAVEIPTVEFGLVDVYLKEKLDINSEVKFFDVDAIPNNLDIEINGVKYVNLFPLPIEVYTIAFYRKGFPVIEHFNEDYNCFKLVNQTNRLSEFVSSGHEVFTNHAAFGGRRDHECPNHDRARRPCQSYRRQRRGERKDLWRKISGVRQERAHLYQCRRSLSEPVAYGCYMGRCQEETGFRARG